MRDRIAMMYGSTDREKWNLSDDIIWQLYNCKSEEARRLILGVSR